MKLSYFGTGARFGATCMKCLHSPNVPDKEPGSQWSTFKESALQIVRRPITNTSQLLVPLYNMAIMGK